MKPTERSTRIWREKGLSYQRVEFKPPGQWKTYDAFGFIDYILLHPARGIIGVQIGGPGSHQYHKRKILAEPRARTWLVCGGIIEIHTWSKVLKERGSKVRVWKCKVEVIELSNFFDK